MKKNILVAILICCRQFSAAQSPNIDSLLQVVNTTKEDTGKVIAYRMLTGLTANSNPSKAVVYGRLGAALGKKIGFAKGVAGCFLNISNCYSNAGKPDSALVYADSAIAWSVKAGEAGRISLAYLNRGDYKRQMGNMKGALADCDTALVYAEKANKDDTKARVLQTIGSVYHAQDNWQQSKLYSEKAYHLYEKSGNKKMMAIVMNNLGNMYKHTRQYELAITSFENAIRLAHEIDDKVNMPMYYSNMADVYLENGSLQKAETHGLQSLSFARSQQNDMQVAQAQMVLASVYIKMGKFSSAIQSGMEGYDIFKKNELDEEAQVTADVLAEAYYKSGNYRDAYYYMQVSRTLIDSVSRNKFHGEVASMQTKFQVKEKDNEILLLAKDKELQQQKLRQQWLLIIGASVITLLVFIGAWMLLNRNKLKQRMKELELRNQIAADLHDEVGSSLSSIHMLSQMANTKTDNSEQKSILDRVSKNAKETMERMSDIVWMIKPGDTDAGNLKQRMERFAREICSGKDISLQMDLAAIDTIKPSMEQRKNIYLIFKEAINNAVKYSGSETINVNATLQANQLLLSIQDHGKGFDPLQMGRGNGLDNMKNRAKESGGFLQIDTAPGTGTEIQLTVPV